MCKKVDHGKNPNNRIDKCMRPLIKLLEKDGYKNIVACCCGHCKYPMTIIVKLSNGLHQELFTGIHILRKKKFYKRDDEGYYYIPELDLDNINKRG